ncbi:MAG: hypothetical protein ACLTKP_03890 [Limosilactobacillus mucosae]
MINPINAIPIVISIAKGVTKRARNRQHNKAIISKIIS